jgi:16S rRNA processing protein RimM
LKFLGIDSIAEAEPLIGAELRIRTADLLPPPEGSVYTFQLKGCAVYADGEYIGTVTDVLDYGGTEILKVDLDEQETLIPFAESYLGKLDLEGRRIDVKLPEGLRDINR